MDNRCHGLDSGYFQASSNVPLEISFNAYECGFSPLTANIYFPAIPVISDAFHKSVELINLTVTMYMVLQGVCKSSLAFNFRRI